MSGRRDDTVALVLILSAAGYFGWQFFRARQGAPAPLSPPVGSPSAPAPVRTPTTPKPAGGSQPIGIRQNNPGNIRPNPANNWQGQRGSAGGYLIFDTPVNGLRAAAILLRNYKRLYGLDTLRKIADRWAPAADNNNPAAWASNVARGSGIAINAGLNLDSAEVLANILRGIVQAENGAKYVDFYPRGVLLQAANLALRQ